MATNRLKGNDTSNLGVLPLENPEQLKWCTMPLNLRKRFILY